MDLVSVVGTAVLAPVNICLFGAERAVPSAKRGPVRVQQVGPEPSGSSLPSTQRVDRHGGRYHHGMDGQNSDRGLLILLWVLGLAVIAFILVAGVVGMTP